MLFNSILVSGLLSLSAANLAPEAAPLVEGKHKPCCREKCNTLTPKGEKYFKKPENKKKRTHLILEQNWTSSTSGSTINEKFDRRRRNKKVDKHARGSFSEDSYSASASLEVEKTKKHGKRHAKRALSVSYSASASAEHQDARYKSRRFQHLKNKKKCYLKVKPRKHRHHTRRIVIDECAESSTYAFDVKRAQKHSKSGSRSFSRSFSGSKESASAHKSVSFKKGKRHAKRELIEGKGRKTTKLSKSESFSHSAKSFSYSASGSVSFSGSSEHCEFQRVPVRVCKPVKKPCKHQKPCKPGKPHKKGCKAGRKMCSKILAKKTSRKH